jgi:hypothetical protein
MNLAAPTESKLYQIARPVLADMEEGMLRTVLLETFEEESESLLEIEHTFDQLTFRSYNKEALRKFFASWSKTNNSAASVSGLASRITLLAGQQQDPDIARQLFNVCSSLQRITDEDLGALGGMLHSDLFYIMATAVCGDDAWLTKSYCEKSAQEFKDWTDRQRLRERDHLKGLLTTLIHEVYTHGEVEFIHPLFQNWFEYHIGIPTDRIRYTVAWVTVHTGGTESNHFGHAVDAIQNFSNAMNVPIDADMAREIFRDYLRRKAAAMRVCSLALQHNEIAHACSLQ